MVKPRFAANIKEKGKEMKRISLIVAMAIVLLVVLLTVVLSGCYDSTKKEGDLQKRTSLTVRDDGHLRHLRGLPLLQVCRKGQQVSKKRGQGRDIRPFLYFLRKVAALFRRFRARKKSCRFRRFFFERKAAARRGHLRRYGKAAQFIVTRQDMQQSIDFCAYVCYNSRIGGVFLFPDGIRR